jgi:hypothetical protein
VGAKSRNKGKRGEREVVALARQHGLHAERTWQTAQAPDPTTRSCDVEIEGEPFQVKIQSDGFSRLYHELEGVRGVFLRCDRGEWLVVLRAGDYLRLLSTSGQSKVRAGHNRTVRNL